MTASPFEGCPRAHPDPDGYVRLHVGTAQHTVVTIPGDDGCAMALVLPYPLSAAVAASCAVNVALFYDLLADWSGRSLMEWEVTVVADAIELYMPPPPGKTNGTAIALDDDEVVELMEALAQSLALLRAQRQALATKPATAGHGGES